MPQNTENLDLPEACFALARNLARRHEVCLPLIFRGWGHRPIMEVSIPEFPSGAAPAELIAKAAFSTETGSDLYLSGAAWGCDQNGAYCPPSLRHPPACLQVLTIIGTRYHRCRAKRRPNSRTALDFQLAPFEELQALDALFTGWPRPQAEAPRKVGAWTSFTRILTPASSYH